MAIEMRVYMQDLDKFEEKAKAVGFTKDFSYESVDVVFGRTGEEPNLSEESIRVRDGIDGAQYILSRYDLSEGIKVPIKEKKPFNNIEDAITHAQSEGFVEIFRFNKKGTIYKRNEQMICADWIEHVGYCPELKTETVEGLDALKKELELEGFELETKPVPQIVYDKVRKA